MDAYGYQPQILVKLPCVPRLLGPKSMRWGPWAEALPGLRSPGLEVDALAPGYQEEPVETDLEV